LAESSAVATRVGAVRRIVVAAPDYLARHGTPRLPADLAAHAIIAFAAISGAERWAFDDRTGETSVAGKPPLVVNTSEPAGRAGNTAEAAGGAGACGGPTKAPTFRSPWSSRGAGPRRRSCAPSSISRCRGCGGAARRSCGRRMLKGASDDASLVLPLGCAFF